MFFGFLHRVIGAVGHAFGHIPHLFHMHHPLITIFAGHRVVAIFVTVTTTIVIGVGGVTIIIGPTNGDTTPQIPGQEQTTPTPKPEKTPTREDKIRTWWHENGVKDAEKPLANNEVRESPFYSVSVSAVDGTDSDNSSFTYMSIPRNGNPMRSDLNDDGAKFQADNHVTMSWSSFEYDTDVYVDVTLQTGAKLTDVNQVTVRPAKANIEKKLLSDKTVRLYIPQNNDGYRLSVEFAPELMDVYRYQGGLTLEGGEGHEYVGTEPKNSMLLFAQPWASRVDPTTIPTEADGTITYVTPGEVTNLDTVDTDIVYFKAGTYWMTNKYSANLPDRVKWVYFEPGAFVKGAFQFGVNENITNYKVTGYGVLSSEQYLYETDMSNGYKTLEHKDGANCHATCVKALKFTSTTPHQVLDLQGVTIKEPSYHSFVEYGFRPADPEKGSMSDAEFAEAVARNSAIEGANEQSFSQRVRNYQQVGSWYWQTDGMELYPGSSMKSSFFHTNDDAMKLYHSNVDVSNVVVWKNDNGPVFQWGWNYRNTENVKVDGTTVVHSLMNNSGATNTCVFNSSPHWNGGAFDYSDPSTTLKNWTISNTVVEGSVNCGFRIYALSNMENFKIINFHVDSWNGQPEANVVSRLTRPANKAGKKVTIGNETVDHNGIEIRNFSVGDTFVTKAGGNWASNELGRLDFDADCWDNWNATADGKPENMPTLSVEGLKDQESLDSRHLSFKGATDGNRVVVTVNGANTELPVVDGAFSADLTLDRAINSVRVSAYSPENTVSRASYTIYSFGDKIGTLSDPSGDDFGAGTVVYPKSENFNPGSFDLLETSVYRDNDHYQFVTRMGAPVNNPWGMNQMSTQRLNIYIRSEANTSTDVTPLLAGTNTFANGGWDYVLIADGRSESLPYNMGVYDNAGKLKGEVTLKVAGDRIMMSVDRRALDGVDLAKASYQVSIYSSSEDGEGVGNVRPIYSAECYAGGKGCPDFVKNFRFGGGKGIFTNESPYDSDTTDSNAIDIISGAIEQSKALSVNEDGKVVVPFVGFDARH